MRSANPSLFSLAHTSGRLALACVLCLLPVCGINDTTTPRVADYYPLPPSAQVGDEFFIGVHPEPVTSDVGAPMAFVRWHIEEIYRAAAKKGFIAEGTPITGCGGSITQGDYQHDENNLFCVKIPNPIESIPQLLRNFQIRYIEAHGRVIAAGVQLCPPSWGLDQIDQYSIPRQNGVYAYDKTGNGVRVYVVDTGIDKSTDERNPFLNQFGPGIYADKMKAYYAMSDSDILDSWGHGTLVTGIVASRSYGVAKKATIFPIKIDYTQDKVQPDVIAATANSVWVAINKFRQDSCSRPDLDSIPWPAVVLLPFTTEAAKSVTLGTEVSNLIKCGYVVINSAGNVANPAGNYSPADVDKVITVGSFDRLGNFDPTSNFGTAVDILAPGRDVVSLVPTALKSSVPPRFSGTSAAAAHVAGVAAQILEEHAKDLTDMKKAPDLVMTQLLRFAATGVQGLRPNTFDRALVSPYGNGATDDIEELAGIDKRNDAISFVLCPENMSCDIKMICDSALANSCSTGLMESGNCGRGVLCDRGQCSSCGLKAERCCGVGGKRCRPPNNCIEERCVCGARSQPCCSGATPCDSDSLGCKYATETCEPCGLKPGQPCCPGRACRGPNLVCAALSAQRSECQSCGAPGELCCEDLGCGPGQVCKVGMGGVKGCQACGGIGQPCCKDVGCGSGSNCQTDMMGQNTCQPCGGPGQQCCADLSCGSGHICKDNPMGPKTCEPCGGPGQQCCKDLGCGSGHICIDNPAGPKTCEPCGGPGQQCCKDLGCGSGHICIDNPAGPKTCEPCGGPGQQCCKDLGCGSGHICKDNPAGPKTCEPCGGPGQPCCKDLVCSSGSTCKPKEETKPDGDKVCRACGGPNEPCCPGPRYCGGEMTCTDTPAGKRCNGECYARCKNGLLLFGKDQVDRAACIEFGRVQCNACATPPSIEQLLRVQYLGTKTELRGLSCPVQKDESCEDCGGRCEKTDMSMLTCVDEHMPTTYACGKACSAPGADKLSWCITSRTSCQ